MVSQENGEPGLCFESTIFAWQRKYQAVRLQGFVTRSRVRISAGRPHLGNVFFFFLDLKTRVRKEGRKTFKMAAPTLCHAHVRLVFFILLNDDRSVLAWFVWPRSLSVRRLRLLDNGIKGANVRRVWQWSVGGSMLVLRLWHSATVSVRVPGCWWSPFLQQPQLRGSKNRFMKMMLMLYCIVLDRDGMLLIKNIPWRLLW